jgi:hypothetical protein
MIARLIAFQRCPRFLRNQRFVKQSQRRLKLEKEQAEEEAAAK